jgi:hypothetical protein
MARIRFKADEIFESIGPGKGPLFPKDFVLDENDVGVALGVRQDSAHAASFVDRWVNMGLAVRVGDDVAASDPKSIEIVGGPAVAPVLVEPPTQVEKTDLTKLSRVELEAVAEQRGIDVSAAKNKGEIIAALDLGEDA